jgi:hypothetical protein
MWMCQMSVYSLDQAVILGIISNRMLFFHLTYSTIEWDNPSSETVSTKSTHPLINTTCLNNKTRNYLTERAKFSLLFLPTTHTNFKASDALLWRLTYLMQHCLADTTELRIALKLATPYISLLRLKSKRSFNISLTLICEDLRLGCAR